jgi:CPA1 family monovalent cation:H+ antiporter
MRVILPLWAPIRERRPDDAENRPFSTPGWSATQWDNGRMEQLIIGVGAVIAIVAVTSLGSKVGIAPPLILIGLGIALSFLPDLSSLEVGPSWILVGILPPLLYASAVSVPVVEFRRDLVAIGGLAIVLVVGTAVVLGFVVHALIPGVPLPIGIALGAILSPTDAVATTIVKRLGVPSRIITMLDGESLLNDATALVLLRSAIAASAVGLNFVDVTVDFLRAAFIAAIVGALVGWLGVRVRSHIHNVAASTSVSFLIPFVAYVPSEELHASGLVAVVVAGLVSNLMSPHRLDAQVRMNESANWKTVEFLLEGAVFLLMGVQFRHLVTKVQTSHNSVALAFGLGALAIVIAIAVRAVFMTGLVAYLRRRTQRKVRRQERLSTVGDALGLDMAEPSSWSVDDLIALRLANQPSPGPGGPSVGPLSSALAPSNSRPARRRRRQIERRRQAEERQQRGGGPGGPGPVGSRLQDSAHRRRSKQLSRRLEALKTGITRYFADIDYLLREDIRPREGTMLVWAGMRGVVTLAAAQTLPVNTPHRALLILVAFTVAAGSMLLQGGTLSWVARRLDLVGRDIAPEGEQAALDQALGEAALAALDDPKLHRPNGEPFDPRLIALLKLSLVVRQLEHDGLIEEATTNLSNGQDTPAADADEPTAGAGTVDATADETTTNETTANETTTNETTADAETNRGPAPPDDHPDTAGAETSQALAVWSHASRLLLGDDETDSDNDEAEATLDTLERKRQYRELRHVSLQAKREALLEARAVGTYSYRTLSAAMAVLDADEISLDLRARTHE